MLECPVSCSLKKRRRRDRRRLFVYPSICCRLEFQDQIQAEGPLVLLGILIERLESVRERPVIPNLGTNQKAGDRFWQGRLDGHTSGNFEVSRLPSCTQVAWIGREARP